MNEHDSLVSHVLNDVKVGNLYRRRDGIPCLCTYVSWDEREGTRWHFLIQDGNSRSFCIPIIFQAKWGGRIFPNMDGCMDIIEDIGPFIYDPPT